MKIKTNRLSLEQENWWGLALHAQCHRSSLPSTGLQSEYVLQLYAPVEQPPNEESTSTRCHVKTSDGLTRFSAEVLHMNARLSECLQA